MNIYDQLRRDEGHRLFPYQDSEGHLTIGVGHNLEHGLPEHIVNELLHHDLDLARVGLIQHPEIGPIYASLSDARRGVLQNMAFNMGVEGVAGFHLMLAALTHGDWSKAADEMLNSLWAQQVGDRADRLATQMRLDTWQ